jgi:hypothetical protein
LCQSRQQKRESPHFVAESENKVEKDGTFFNGQNMTVKTPRQPHNSPHCRHNFTITTHPKTQKSPYKTPSSP